MENFGKQFVVLVLTLRLFFVIVWNSLFDRISSGKIKFLEVFHMKPFGTCFGGYFEGLLYNLLCTYYIDVQDKVERKTSPVMASFH